MATRHHRQHRSFQSPDETREFSNGRADILNDDGNHTWAVGDEEVVVVDWYGASNYAKGS